MTWVIIMVTCQYEKDLHYNTLWSVVYNLNSLYNEIAKGNPKKTPFKYDNRLEWGISKQENNYKSDIILEYLVK